MMRFRPAGTYSPIGLDLGRHSFKAIQLRRCRGDRTVNAQLTLARLSPDAAIDAAELTRLRGVLDRNGFVGADVVINVPAEQLLTASLELPAKAPGVPLQQLASIEFARVHKQETADLTMSTWELPAPARAGKATYMLAVGALSGALEARVELIESSGLNVVVIDEPFSAAVRGCRSIDGSIGGPELTAVIDLGWSSASLSMLKEGTVVYTRRLSESGVTDLRQAAMAAVGGGLDVVDDEIWKVGFDESARSQSGSFDVIDVLDAHVDCVAREIAQAFGYTSHRYHDAPVAATLLIGGGATIPGIAGRFGDVLGVPTAVAGGGQSGDCISPGLSTALGLALWDRGGE